MSKFANLDEIVFENREKRYGAYVLRKEYIRYLGIGFLVVLFLFGLATIGPKIYAKYLKDVFEKQESIEVDAKLTELNTPPPPEEPEEKKPDIPPPPPPPKDEPPPPPPPPVETKAFKVPEPKPKEEVKEEETIADQKDLKDAVIDTKDQKGEKAENANFVPPAVTDPNGSGQGPAVINEPPPPPPPPKKEEPKNDEPDPNKFVPVQKRPEPVNLGDVKKTIGYPPIAKDGGIEGQVLLNILVDEEGNYKKHIVKSSAHPILLKEVEKHVSTLRFTPAVQGGKAIPFWVVVPFKFELKGN